MAKKTKKSVKTKISLRPPVVTIMGHVDHGKTSLLDFIRKTKVAAGESGGITQHIGAYQVDFGKGKITFIDTPGHEAFAKMRSRGAQVTDIVVLVVAANDGVMPQTIESIQHIKAAKVLLLVAINKMDLPEANIDRVKRQLTKNDVLVEGYGGDVVSIPLSAKTGKGVDELLEMISLMVEMNPEKFKNDPKGKLIGYIIESKMDKHCGILATVLIKNGMLRVGDEVVIDNEKSKIRAMRNQLGENRTDAGPSTPVEIMGLNKIPAVGTIVNRLNEEIISEKVLAEEKSKEAKIEAVSPNNFKIILKADAVGSLEALIYSLPEDVEIFEKGTGDISESDVLLAKNVGAIILGFNVKSSPGVEKLAETENVLIKTYRIIYELLDEIDDVMAELKKPVPTEKILGKAKIIADFAGTVSHIAGCRIMEGKINKNDILRLERNSKILADQIKIMSLKQAKKDVDKVSMGMECGLVLSSEVDFRPGDMLISYRKLVN